jgi:hypothetical protein
VYTWQGDREKLVACIDGSRPVANRRDLEAPALPQLTMKLRLTSNLAVVVRHNTLASIEHTACSRKSPKYGRATHRRAQPQRSSWNEHPLNPDQFRKRSNGE